MDMCLFLSVVCLVYMLGTCSAQPTRFQVSPHTVRYYNRFGVYLNYQQNTSLVCRPHDDARDVIISDLDGEGRISARLSGDRYINAEYRDKYSISHEEGSYSLSISELSIADSSFYRCSWQYDCWFGWICSYTSRYLYLWVYEDSFNPQSPENCFLLDSKTSVYFIGDQLSLRCSVELSEAYVDNSMITGILIMDGIAPNEYVYNISVDGSFNGTTLNCKSNETGEDVNLCELIPLLRVYEDLQLTISPSKVTVRDGESANFRCMTNIYEPTTFSWNITGDENFTLANVTMEPIPGGSELFLSGITFGDYDTSSFSIICMAAFHTSSNVAHASVERWTPPSVNVRESQENEGTGDGHGALVLAIVLPSMFVLIVGIIILLAVLYCRRSDRRKMETEDPACKGKTYLSAKSEGTHYDSRDFGEDFPTQNIDNCGEVYNVAYVSHDSRMPEAVDMESSPKSAVKSEGVYYSTADSKKTASSPKADYFEGVYNVAYASYDNN